MDKKLAIIGCGGMVYDFIYEYLKKLPVRLAAICGEKSDTDRFSKMYSVDKIYSDYKKMLDEAKPELVIAFPSDDADQFEIVSDCLKIGANVFCERPVGHTLEQARELVKLQKTTGKFVMPRYNRRFMPAYITAKKIISNAEFGRNYMYQAKFHAPAYHSEQMFIYNHLSHHLDLARMLLGEIKITHVSRVFENDTRVGFNIVFENEHGLIGNIQSSSFLCGQYPMERVEICGDSCNVIVDNVRHLEYNQPAPEFGGSKGIDILREGGTKIFNINCAQLNNYTFYGFEGSLEHFVRCSVTGEKPSPDMEDAMKTLNLVFDVIKLINR